jgi:hypothetical protein
MAVTVCANLQAYLHPDSEHWLDWFHITMRISVLQQQVLLALVSGVHRSLRPLPMQCTTRTVSQRYILAAQAGYLRKRKPV